VLIMMLPRSPRKMPTPTCAPPPPVKTLLHSMSMGDSPIAGARTIRVTTTAV
jgi:hypothetical protein